MNLALRTRVRELRREGKTYSEIRRALGVIPKGTLAGWCKDIELNSLQLKRIEEIVRVKGALGRQRGAWKNHANRIARLDAIRKRAIQEFPAHLQNQLFLAGLFLYLAEGTKSMEYFLFMNSDFRLINFMVQWIEQNSDIPFKDIHFRLYIHSIYAHENCEQFWIDKIGMAPEQLLKTVYKPTVHTVKKNPMYKGCLRVEVPGSELYWLTMTWRDCFFSSFDR